MPEWNIGNTMLNILRLQGDEEALAMWERLFHEDSMGFDMNMAIGSWVLADFNRRNRDKNPEKFERSFGRWKRLNWRTIHRLIVGKHCLAERGWKNPEIAERFIKMVRLLEGAKYR